MKQMDEKYNQVNSNKTILYHKIKTEALIKLLIYGNKRLLL